MAAVQRIVRISVWLVQPLCYEFIQHFPIDLLLGKRINMKHVICYRSLGSAALSTVASFLAVACHLIAVVTWPAVAVRSASVS